jgi:hypothetical protein
VVVGGGANQRAASRNVVCSLGLDVQTTPSDHDQRRRRPHRTPPPFAPISWESFASAGHSTTVWSRRRHRCHAIVTQARQRRPHPSRACPRTSSRRFEACSNESRAPGIATPLHAGSPGQSFVGLHQGPPKATTLTYCSRSLDPECSAVE